MLVGAAIGTAFYRAISQQDTPPQIQVKVTGVTAAAHGHVVEFEVQNSGTQTAAVLNIEAQLMNGGQSVETSTATVAYSPSNSTRRGGIFFTKDPNKFQIEIRALGYESP